MVLQCILIVNTLNEIEIIRDCGGIGIRNRLKICRSIDLVGSSPTNPIERVIYMITKEELIENIEILADKCEELIKERDQARRLVCKYTKKTYHTLKETAELRGWDCFKDYK